MDYDDLTRPKILALDLDGTVLNYNGSFEPGEFGEAIRGMIEELEKLRTAGWKIVIWSCRSDSPEMREHLKQQGIPFDYINEHPWNGPDNPRKIHADVYLDERNVPFSGIATGLADKVMSHQPWWKSASWL